MITPNLIYIFIVESLIFVIGTIFFFVELKLLMPTIYQKATYILLLLLLSINSVYLTRSLGILLDNSNLRQLGPAIGAFFGTLLLIYWGGIMINVDSKTIKYAFGIVIFGILLFILGVLISQPYVSIFGAFLLGFVAISSIVLLFKYTFKKTPYLRSRYRIFLMTLAFSIMIIGDTGGAISMRLKLFSLASLLFLIELPARIIMLSSISLPLKLQDYLSKFIN